MSLGQCIIIAAGLNVIGRLMELFLTFARQDRRERDAKLEWAQESERARVWVSKQTVFLLERRKGN